MTTTAFFMELGINTENFKTSYFIRDLKAKILKNKGRKGLNYLVKTFQLPEHFMEQTIYKTTNVSTRAGDWDRRHPMNNGIGNSEQCVRCEHFDCNNCGEETPLHEKY